MRSGCHRRATTMSISPVSSDATHGAGAKPPIRILIADDHPMLREGVAAVIQMQPDMIVVGEAEDGDGAIAEYDRLRPDITLIDLRMPGKSGVIAIEAIRRQHPEARLIVLTTFTGDAQALQALRAGASGYLLKSSLRRDLLDAIRNVHAGHRHLQPEIANGIALHAIDDPLSPREIEILQMIATGKANKEVARLLGLSEDTIKSHVKSIFGKLYVSDRTHAVTVAAKRGIIDL
jgi:DNA-binding NarL/FixJ family response regulator